VSVAPAPPPPRRRRREAVVLSGGGANGAYEVGVLKALAAGRSEGTGFRPLDPEIFCGTSIGAFNAALLVSRWDGAGTAAVGELERVWLEELAEQAGGGNGGFRLRANPRDVLDPRRYLPNPVRPLFDLARDTAFLGWEGAQRAVGLLSLRDESIEQRLVEAIDIPTFLSRDPWLRTIGRTISFQEIRRSSRQLRVAATNWATGELKMFDNSELSERRGPEILMASGALPGIFEAAMVGAEPYVDGGVLMNTPLKAAIAAGAEVIHMVYLDPDVRRIPFSALRNTAGATYRMQTISWAKVVNNDIADAEAVNRAIEMILGIGRGRGVCEQDLKAIFQAGRQLARAVDRVRGHVEDLRLLEVHRYHPADEFPGGPLGLLNLDAERIRDLVEAGFLDGGQHCCEDCGCVIPGGCGSPVDVLAELEEVRRRRREGGEAERPPAAVPPDRQA
jgi:predicted acylesterase/phospholipase RssA